MCQDIKASLRSSAKISEEIQRSDYEAFSRLLDPSLKAGSIKSQLLILNDLPDEVKKKIEE